MNRPQLMGIVNLTPDSFSGDGRLGAEAISHAQQLIADGTDILDIGAESTRPGATPLDADEEWARLAPFLSHTSFDVRLSVDTYHPETAKRALAQGVTIINEVGGLQQPAMLQLLAMHDAGIVVMHALGLPADKAVVWPADIDPVAEILRWKTLTEQRAASYGIDPNRLMFDPGLGFGKTSEQSLALVMGAKQLVQNGGRWLFGHSRKSFLSLFGDVPATERDGLTLAFSTMLAEAGVSCLRVHNVAAHRALFERICM